MLARAHSLAGGSLYLAASATATRWYHLHQDWRQITIGTVVATGAALLPDLDMSGAVIANKGGATVAHTFGRVSMAVAEVTDKACRAVRNTLRMRGDKRVNAGHRTASHTILAAICSGVGATELCAHQGRYAVVAVLALCFGLAYRGLLPREANKAGVILTTVASVAAAGLAYLLLPTGRGYPLIGAAVGVGWLSHLLADACTREGAPLAWPLPIGRRMWRMWRLPLCSCKTGSRWETWGWTTVFVLVAAASSLSLIWPSAHHAWTALH